VGRVGKDGFGDFMVSEARRHGADSSLLVRDESADTSASLVIVDGDGERSFIHALGANAKLTPNDVPLEHLKSRGARVLHIAGIFALPGMEGVDGAPTRDLLARASSMGFVSSLDSVWDASGRWSTIIGPMLEQTDIFCPSILEAQAIVGASENANPREIALKLFSMGVRKIVALKMGAEGSFVMAREGETHRLGILSVPAVDGTGSGDAFIAGLLTGFLEGKSLLECAKLGTAAGAMCVRALGAMPGITDRAELEHMALSVPVLDT
jgi:sugar/nucleoside kinase (ribokinase family)